MVQACDAVGFCFQLAHHDRVDSLVLVNPNASQAGWIEWGYQKVTCSWCITRMLSTITVLKLDVKSYTLSSVCVVMLKGVVSLYSTQADWVERGCPMVTAVSVLCWCNGGGMGGGGGKKGETPSFCGVILSIVFTVCMFKTFFFSFSFFLWHV